MTLLLLYTSTSAQLLFCPYRPSNVTAGRYGPSSVNSLVAVFNPATATYISGVETGAYIEKKYLTDINVLTLSAALGFQKNGLGLLFQHFGNASYSERTAGLSYAKKLGKLNIGIGVSRTAISVPGYKKSSVIQTIVSSVIELTGEVSSSATILNPNGFIRTTNDALRAAPGYALGFGWQGSQVVYAGIEILKQESQPLNILLNVQYHFSKEFSGTIHWSTFTNQPNLSVAWKRKNIKFEAGGSYHPALGISPALTILYKQANKPE